ARAAHLPEDSPELQDEARRFLVMAGERQTSLDVAQAAAYYQRALDLTPIGHPERPSILRTTTSFGWRSGQLEVGAAVRASEQPGSTAVMTPDIRGNGRLELGDLDGMDDLWEALKRSEAAGVALDVATSYSYLSEWVGVIEGPTEGLAMNDASVEVCDRRGIKG